MACLSWQACRWGCNSLYPRALAIARITGRSFWRPRPVPDLIFWQSPRGRSSLSASRMQKTAGRTKRPEYRSLVDFRRPVKVSGYFPLPQFRAIPRIISCSEAVPARYRRARLPCIFQARKSPDSSGSLPAISPSGPRLRDAVRD